MPPAVILPPDSALFRRLHRAAVEQRCIFFAGLPGVGKSLLLQQLCALAGAAGRRVHLLQWDVARTPFETTEILARYPETDGVTHAVIRRAVGVWARGAVVAWHQRHPDRADLLVGELPLIGSRLIELVQRQADAVEPLLVGPESVFFVPVPSREVRRAIEAAREREMASPGHERERANAIPSLVRALWAEVAAVAGLLGLRAPGAAVLPPDAPTPDGSAPDAPASRPGTAMPPGQPGQSAFDPDLYAAVYMRLLRHRRAERLDVTVTLPVRASVYDALDAASELVPSAQEVARILAELGARPQAEVEREVAAWYRV